MGDSVTTSIRVTVIAALFAVTVLTFTSCASAPDSSGTSFSVADIQVRGEQARSEGNDFVADVFEDGSVTEAEYLEAIDGFTACMTEYGYAVSAPVLSPMDSLSYSTVSDPAGQDADLYNERYMECSVQ